MARLSDAEIADIKRQAQPLEGSPYAYQYTSAPTPTDMRVVFQHTVALSYAEALAAIEAGKAKLADGTGEWSSGEKYVPTTKDA